MELLGHLHHWFIYASISEVMGVFCIIGALIVGYFIGD